VLVRREGKTDEERINARAIVMSLTYEDEESKSDLLKLVVQNNHLKNFDNPLWAPGNILTVAWGYVGNMSIAREAKITKVTGSTELQVEAQGAESDMNRLVKQRRFENMTRGEVAAQIAKEHGFAEAAAFVQREGDKEETVVQSGETDAQFLRRMAETEGYEFYADVNGFHFHERQLKGQPIKEVRWYLPGRTGLRGEVGDIITWSVESDVYGTPRSKPGKIKLKGRDPGTKKSFTVTASDADTERATLSTLPLVPDEAIAADTFQTNISKEDVRRTSQTSESAAKREVDGEYKRAMLDAVELSMTLVGDPSIGSKSVLAISGISKRLSGLYWVKSVTHNISSSGYTTDLKLASDGVEPHAFDQAGIQRAIGRSKGKPNKIDPNHPWLKQPYVLQAVRETQPDGSTWTRYFDAKGTEIPALFVDESRSFVFES
jgi:phage protein D